jgi:hypothetical protein
MLARVAPALLLLADLLLMAFLVLLALDGSAKLPNVSTVLPALVSGLLGLVTNPQTLVRPWHWVLMLGAALAAGVVGAVEVLLFPTHTAALPTVIAAVAAVGALFVDTTTGTHSAGSA